MNLKRFVAGSLLVFIFIFFFEFFLHGFLLEDTYKGIPQLMRSEEEMLKRFQWIVAGEFLMSVIFCFIFAKGYENRGIGEGVRFGILVGVGFGVSEVLIQYAVHPFPNNLIVSWLIGYPIEMILAGCIIAAVYKGPAAAEAANASEP